jgi:hypothetical protein
MTREPNQRVRSITERRPADYLTGADNGPQVSEEDMRQLDSDLGTDSRLGRATREFVSLLTSKPG